MKKKLSIIVFIAIIAMFIIPCLFISNNNTAKAETLYETISISKDKFVDKTGGYDNWSSSVGKTLYVGQYNNPNYGYTQSVIGFDILSLPENITSIKLYFYVNVYENNPKYNVYGSETDDWTNNATVPNKDIELVNSKGISAGWNSVDVTSFVLDQYNGDKYATLVMSPTITSSHNGFSFFARENSSNKPYIKVAYANPSLNAVPSQDIKEANINGMDINLTIVDDTFNSSTLNKDMFTLGNDAIANGVTIGSITYIDDTHATLTLACNQDIDEHFNILVTIDGSQLTGGFSVTSSSIYVESIYEITVGGTYNLDDMGVDANIEISTTAHVILTQTSQDAKENFTISYLVSNADLEIDSIKIDNENSATSATDHCLKFMGDSNKLTLSGNSEITAYKYRYSSSSYRGSQAILVDESTVLEICGTGALIAVSRGDTAIGSQRYDKFGTINITGGNITATGGSNSSAIGGSNGGTINISGGTITATGGSAGPGIGSSEDGGCTINISGGTITATGGTGGAGIGTAKYADGGIVNISGGLIYARGNVSGTYNSRSADIGNGILCTGCQVSITDSSVVFLKINELATNNNITIPFYDTETITNNMAYGFSVPDSWSGTAYAYISNNIKVNGVSLLPESADLDIISNETITLTTNVIPSYASDTSVSYSSSDETVATVSSSGVVSCVSEGTAVITVTTTDGGYTDTCDVTVCKKVTGVTLTPESQTLVLGDADTSNDSITLTTVVSPGDATDKTVTYNSSNSLVATVDSNGLVTAIKAGTATITVKTTDGGYTDTCDITVEQTVTGFSITPETSTLILGDVSTANDSISLSTVFLPSDATDKSVTWVSSNASAATVDSAGLVTAIKPGTTTITATTNDGGFTDTCEITVEQRTAGIDIDLANKTLVLGDVTKSTVQLTAIVSPADASNKDVIWTSSDDTIATVDSTGFVTGINVGSATIKAETIDGGYTDTCNISVEIRALGVSLDKNAVTYKTGISDTLVCTVNPDNAPDKTVTWSIDNAWVADIAVVDDVTLMITAKEVGIANITVTTNDGGYTDICKVTVVDMTEYAVSKYGGLTGNLLQNDGTTGIENWNVTLYSTPVSVTTNVNGDFGYSGVQYSHHTLVFTDSGGVEFDRYTLNFSSGSSTGYSVSGDTITLNYTSRTTSIDMDFSMNAAGTEVELADVAFNQMAINPQTGEKSGRMWWFVCIMAVLVLMMAAAVVYRRKTTNR